MKQRTARELRQSLFDLLPDALYEIEPEESFTGMEKAVSLWDAAASGNTELPEAIGGSVDGREESDTEPLEEIFEFGAEIDSESAKAALGGTSGERTRQSVMVRE